MCPIIQFLKLVEMSPSMPGVRRLSLVPFTTMRPVFQLSFATLTTQAVNPAMVNLNRFNDRLAYF